MLKSKAVQVASGVAVLVAGTSAIAMHTTHPPPQANLSSPGPITLEVADASDPVVAVGPAPAPEASPEPAPEVPATEVPAPAVASSPTWTYEAEGDDGAPDPYVGGSGNTSGVDIYCESGGDYAANTGNGYYGAYQWLPSTFDAAIVQAGHPEWAGTLPSVAPPAVQDDAAEAWVAAGHRGAWPNC